MGDGEYLWPVAAPAAAARRSAAGELLSARTVSRDESWLSAGPELETGSGRGSDPEPVPEAVPELEPEFGLDLLLESAPSCAPSAPAGAPAAKPTRGSEPICICIGMLLLKSSAEAPFRAGGRGGGGGNWNEEDTVSGEGTAGCVAVANDRNPYGADVGVATTAVGSKLLGFMLRLWLWFILRLWFGFRLRLGFGEMERSISRAPGFRLATATVSIGLVASGEKCTGYVGICVEGGICCGAYAVAQYAAGILIMPAIETGTTLNSKPTLYKSTTVLVLVVHQIS